MRTAKTSHPTKHAKAARRVENTTDATRGEPLATRALKRKAELEAILATIPADRVNARNDIETALGTVEGLLTGDVEHVSHRTGEELSRWLEHSKHLAELAPRARGRSKH